MKTNKDIVEAVFRATAEANGRPFVEAMAETCVWRAIGTRSWSGVYEGKAAILKNLLGPLGKRIEGGRTKTIARRIHDAGEFVIVEAEGCNRTVDGADYNNQYCFVIRMRNGEMIEIVEYLDTELAEKALGAAVR
ncbi:MAG: nuclear transport factor 2 family protein [Parvularculaceae bacterium]|nr:nuclear transport factor 2 family protein [Parvularculaceae bacterium]